MSLLDSLRRGWWSGWAEFPELLAGGAGLLESLIPGDTPDDPLERLKDWSNQAAKGLRLEGGEGTSEGLLEKIMEGVGAAPGTVASIAPFMLATGGLGGVAGAGAAIARPAIAFGAHGLIRHGDEGLPTAIGHGLRGAAEGAVFGGLGRWASGKYIPKAAEKILAKRRELTAVGGEQALAAKRYLGGGPLAETGIDSLSRQLKRRGLHGVSTGGFVGSMTGLHGGDLEESIAAGTTMGLLGFLASGKYREPSMAREEKIAEVGKTIEERALKGDLPKADRLGVVDDVTAEQATAYEAFKIAKAADDPTRTTFAKSAFNNLKPEQQEAVLEGHAGHIPMGLERLRQGMARGGLDENGKVIHKASAADTFEVELNLGDIHREQSTLAKRRLRAEKAGDEGELVNIKLAEEALRLEEVATIRAWIPPTSTAGSALRAVGLARRYSPEWFEAVKSWEKATGKPIADRIRTLAKLSDGDPEMLSRLGHAMDTPKLWDYFQEYWINGLLSGIPTQAVNTSSNALRGGIDVAEKSAALAMEVKASGGKFTKADAIGEIQADIKAGFAATGPAVKMFFKLLREDYKEQFVKDNPRWESHTYRSKLDHPTASIPGKPGKVVRFPGTALQAMDIAFKIIAGERYAASKSYRMALDKVKSREIKPEQMRAEMDRLNGVGEAVEWTELRHYGSPELVSQAGWKPTRTDAHGGIWFTEGKEYLSGAHTKIYIPKNKLLRIDDIIFGGDRAASKKLLDLLPRGRSKTDEIALAKKLGYWGVKRGRDVALTPEGVKAAKTSRPTDVGGMPHMDVLKAMKENAQRLTFTSPLGAGMQKVLSVRDIEVPIPILGDARPGTMLIPFVSTPWNVIKAAVARSPLGLLRLKNLKQKYKNNKMTSQEYYREMAATWMGTTLTVVLVGAAKAGFVTGGGPVNQQDRQNLLSTGWRPYSLKFGDVYLQLQRLEPLGTILGMAGDIAELGDSDDKAGKIIATIKDNMTDKSFLYGLETFAKAFSNPEQFGSIYLRQMQGSMVPTFFAKMAQAVDPYQRQQEAFGATAGVPDSMAYRIPGVSMALPLKASALGEPRERWGVGNVDTTLGKIASGVQSVVAAMPLSFGREDREVEQEFNRLRGHKGMPPSMPRRTKKLRLRGVDGTDVELTTDEYAIYDRYHAMAKEQLAKMIASPQYARIPDALKSQMLLKTYRKFRAAANKQVNQMIMRRTTVGN